MNVLIPMAGAGSRFTQAGYDLHKPIIPVSSHLAAKTVPMVVAAVEDLQLDLDAPSTRLIFVIRDFHAHDGVDRILLEWFPKARFIVIDKLTEGQADTCLLARDLIDNDEPLLIGACDNGVLFSFDKFRTASREADAIVFTFRDNEAVLQNPRAYGWIRVKGEQVTGVSIKVPISDTPMDDHAVVGTFWFKHGRDFVAAADAMIAAGDRINNEFYVDQVFKYLVNAGRDVRVLEVSRYICWGTPQDYEAYEQTISYWTEFVTEEPWA